MHLRHCGEGFGAAFSGNLATGVFYRLGDAAREICDFYRNFHSYRWVRQQMVIRIQHKLTDAALQKLNDEFSSITTEGQIIQTRHLPEEAEDVHLHHFHRIVLTPDKRDFGMLRLLLNAINDSETIPPED